MKKRLFLLTAALALLCCVIAWGGTPQRIISLAPSLTQGIYAVGAEGRLVGCTSYCFRAIKDGKTVVGTAVKANVEKVVSLKPDLIVVSSFTGDEEIALLRKFGIEVLELDTPKSYDEVCEQFLRLGEAVGAKETAEEIVAESQSTVQGIRDRRKGHYDGEAPSLFFQIGTDPLFAVIPGNFMADYITFLGGRNITGGLSHGQVTREFVVGQDPDYIFVVTMGTAGASESGAWRKLKGLKAVRNKRIFVIDAATACEPSPITFAKTLALLDRLVK